jgi:hypothetical protein
MRKATKGENPEDFRLLVPTNSPGETEAEWRAKGYRVGNLFPRYYHPGLCGDCLWAISFWPLDRSLQPDLFSQPKQEPK